MKIKLTLIPLVAVTTLLLSTGISQARGQNDVVRMAHNIEKISKDLKKEFQDHYRRTRQYNHLMTDVNDLLKKADHIDSLAHNPRTSYRHIKTDLDNIDKLAHHLHQAVDRIDSGCTGNRNHVHAKLVSLDRAVHTMQRGIVVYSRPEPSCGTSGNSHYTQAPRPTYNDRSNGHTAQPARNNSRGNSSRNDWGRFIGNFFNSQIGYNR